MGSILQKNKKDRKKEKKQKPIVYPKLWSFLKMIIIRKKLFNYKNHVELDTKDITGLSCSPL